jgi:organic hydroperoxide reductase OsmC/OhrA
MRKEHIYTLTVKWTGNRGAGTASYKAYDRSHSIIAENKAEILCSSEPTFLGDKTKYNPEELLVASLSTCHMLWYLHLCADAGVIVTDYTDNPTGRMIITTDGRDRFKEVTLHPVVTVQNKSMIEKAIDLHAKAHELCFIANSVNFPVNHKTSFLHQ